MYEWSQYFSHRNTFGHNASYYQQLLLQCKHSFQQRFWYAAGHYLYDVVDGPEGDDAAIRPNQLLALSLSHPLLDMEYGQQVLETVTEHLLTPYGLRTLASREISYRGRGSAGNTLKEQQLALHQGCVWPWLIGPYLDTQFRMWSQQSERRDPPLFREYQWRKGLQLLEPFREHFQTNLLGTCGGIFDGDEPYQPLPRNQFLASATSIGELLRSYNTLAQLSVREQRAGVINVR
jgi:glycogen debranching enzyme